MFYGAGAGGAPTASSVLGDLVAVCRNKLAGVTGPGSAAYARLAVSPMADVVTRYHLAVDVEDGPGVLAEVAGVLGEHGVSVEHFHQERRDGGCRLAMSTHPATDAALSAAVAALRASARVHGVTGIIRIEGR